MSPEMLFARTCSDLENRIASTDDYEILLIAGLLRKLFLDDHPLVDQANKDYRVKLRFTTSIPLNQPEPGDVTCLWSVQDGLDPETARPGKSTQQLTRDQFFQQTVAIVFGRVFSIKDVVLFEANVAGAVHAGAPRTEKEKALQEVGVALGIGGYPMALRQLLAIARVSLKALAPLRAAVAAV